MSPQPTRSPRPTSRRPPVLAIAGGAFLLVVIIGLAIALAAGGGDGEGQGGDPSGTVDPDQATFGPVEVSGDPLPSFDGGATDDAVGLAAPVVTATTPDEREITFGAAGEPTLVVFLAHWCPHCQAELPVLVDMAADGDFDGVRTIAVLTGTNPDAPNFPPVLWLEREGWEGEVALDDQAASAAAVHGLTSYPYLVMLDADGTVTGRIAGEQPAEAIQDLVDSGR